MLGLHEQDPLSAAAAGPALVTPQSLRKELALARAISLAARSGSESAGAADRPGDVLQLLVSNSEDPTRPRHWSFVPVPEQ